MEPKAGLETAPWSTARALPFRLPVASIPHFGWNAMHLMHGFPLLEPKPGLEPGTSWSTTRRSNHLSYNGILLNWQVMVGRPGIEPGVRLSDGVTIRDRTLRSATQKELPALVKMVPWGGFEPPTSPFVAVRSIQLSYQGRHQNVSDALRKFWCDGIDSNY